MSSRYELERGQLIATESTFSRHSMNQRVLKRLFDGETRFEDPRKIRMAKQKSQRLANIREDLEQQKTLRVLERVIASVVGYSGSTIESFEAEARYLKRRGIIVTTQIVDSLPSAELEVDSR